LKRRGNIKAGFTLVELIITLTVAAILMMGMLPLIRIAATRGVEMQLATRDALELQSLMERLAAGAAQTSLTNFYTAVGNGAQNNSYGTYYVHERDYVRFDASHNEAPSTNGAASGLLKLRVGRTAAGPSLVRIFND
jgi:prepilin-type N-terminal cleavage/methylation domain-containing protein